MAKRLIADIVEISLYQLTYCWGTDTWPVCTAWRWYCHCSVHRLKVVLSLSSLLHHARNWLANYIRARDSLSSQLPQRPFSSSLACSKPNDLSVLRKTPIIRNISWASLIQSFPLKMQYNSILYFLCFQSAALLNSRLPYILSGLMLRLCRFFYFCRRRV
jgi:hypothetical protein